METRDFKDTLNLPRTDFPMKANLPLREPEMLGRWESEGLYAKMAGRSDDKGQNRKTYILHDGPPYANGHIHIGHALNKILKDIIVKYKSMRGHYAPYVPGWDCHGLPIELEVDKKLGDKKSSVGISEKRLLCREYAGKFLDIQREEFKRLGVFGRWEKPYLTMSCDYEAEILRRFYIFLTKGYAYKGKKPVHWCPSCVTALAEAEVEYADKQSPSVFVRFPLTAHANERLGLQGKDASILIWTTTPWTLPANLALAVNPTINYTAALTSEGKALIVAEALREQLISKSIITSETCGSFMGSELVGLKAMHPFIERESVVIPGGFVSTEEGSGIVHIAPGHGEDDYEAGLANGLDVFAPVDSHGKFSGSGVAGIEGQFVFKANATIIEILKSKGMLMAEAPLTHSYPHCWRCKKPVIFRATEQWFISMEHGQLRERCLAEVEKTRFVPSWGRERIYGMIKNRPDWCISRQRAWGVPIAVFRCKGCGAMVKDQSVLDSIVGLFEAHGADVWFSKETHELLSAGFKCASCGNDAFNKETDILDVWFDSGVSHAAVLREENGLSWPADMYLEGSDQHRGWFQSSLLASVGTAGSAPYRTVLTHGFTVDGQGRKMSKSVGNVVAPQDIIRQTGAEILRLWVSAEDYRGDVRISKEILDRLVEAYRKIRNTEKYLLGNLHGFDGGDHRAHLLEIDRWALSRLQGLIRDVLAAYEDFRFHEVYHRLYHFCIVDMSAFYLDILKDRLYTARHDSNERRAAQYVLNEILMAMTRLMAPVLSFTAEEVWMYLKSKPAESVFLTDMPEPDEKLHDEALEARWARLIAVRNEVNKALEIKRREKFIGTSLEARVILHVEEPELASLLEAYASDLPMILIVSQAEVSKSAGGAYAGEEVKGLSVSVMRADGARCQRCWNWSTVVGTIEGAPELCTRCHKAIA